MSKKEERISVRITPELKRKLKEICKKEGISQSALVVSRLSDFVIWYNSIDETLEDLPF